MILEICQWLSASFVGRSIRESDNLFSLIETVHVLSIVATAGVIAIADLRLLGLLLDRYALNDALRPLVKTAWYGFAIAAASGGLLFWAEAERLYSNDAFRLKVLLLVLAAINQAAFHAARQISLKRTRVHAAASLGLWSGIIVFGRAIAYL